jgi:hypothetical protein
MKGGIEAVDNKVDTSITEAELIAVHAEHPELRSLLGKKYILAKDRAGHIYVTNNVDIELGVSLFIALSRTHCRHREGGIETYSVVLGM